MRKRILIIITLVLCAVVLAAEAYRCSVHLSTEVFAVPAPVETPIRIVQLTDLHSHTFGSDNSMLVEAVEEQTPDLILMTGDMMDRSDDSPAVVCQLIQALSRIAPVYYSYGNHEYTWMKETGTSLTSALSDAGAIVLDVDYTDIWVKGQPLRLGGYHGYYRQPGMWEIRPEQHRKELDFAEDFENTDVYKILLCHIPTPWLDWEYVEKHPVDLVLSGHYHGGQIRLPLIGGVYAPYVGLLPQYTEGMFAGDTATTILSTGLGSSPGIPRINNLPQIVVVDLLPQT